MRRSYSEPRSLSLWMSTHGRRPPPAPYYETNLVEGFEDPKGHGIELELQLGEGQLHLTVVAVEERGELAARQKGGEKGGAGQRVQQEMEESLRMASRASVVA